MSRRPHVTCRFELPREIHDRLEEITRVPGVCKSRIVGEAVTAFIERKGSGELEHRFAMRLDRLSHQLARIERIARIEVESLALFVHYMLTVNAPLAEGDEAARAIGRDRFNAFIERVAHQVAGGRLTLVPEDEQS